MNGKVECDLTVSLSIASTSKSLAMFPNSHKLICFSSSFVCDCPMKGMLGADMKQVDSERNTKQTFLRSDHDVDREMYNFTFCTWMKGKSKDKLVRSHRGRASCAVHRTL